ncbi:hypothetical protein HOY80DRAFT_1090225 [Tuber brumale]|nr:hypothetical protein HOY80DRAFT_1090225 [Tuber brumale]
MDGADDDKEKKTTSQENDGIPTDEDEDIDSNDALESDENKFPSLKFLAGSTTKQEENLTQSNLSGDNEDGLDEDCGGGAQDEEAKRKEELMKLIINNRINVANIFKAVKEKFDSLWGVRINPSKAIKTTPYSPLCSGDHYFNLHRGHMGRREIRH